MVLGEVVGGTETSAGGIATLHNKILDDAVEDGVVVVALQAQLHEITAGLGRFLRPQLDVDVACRGLKEDLPVGRRFQGVHPQRHDAQAKQRWTRMDRPRGSTQCFKTYKTISETLKHSPFDETGKRNKSVETWAKASGLLGDSFLLFLLFVALDLLRLV